MKAALIDAEGAVRASAQAHLSTARGPDGRMHQDADDWRAAVRAVIADCLRGDASTGTRTEPPVALSLTGQMQDLVLLDAHDRPTHPVVLYSDTQAKAEVAELDRANPTWIPRVTVTPPPGADALPPKLLHVARSAPAAYAASTTVLFSAAGWVAHALTGVRVCDRLTASTTGLFDPRTDDWIPLESPHGGPLVPAHLRLPRLVDPGIVGHVSAQASRTFGVAVGTPVVLALGDAGSATDGTVGSAPGDLYLHLGTTGWVAHVDPTPAAQLLLPEETGETVDRHRLAHSAGHLVIARLPEAGEALARARRDLFGLADPHSPEAHAIAEAALGSLPTGTWEHPTSPARPAAREHTAAAPTRAPEHTGVASARAPERTAATGRITPGSDSAAYRRVVEALAAEVAALLDRLGVRPDRLPATGGVVQSPGVCRLLEEAVGMPLDVVGCDGEQSLTAADAGLLSCARVAFDSLGVEHTVSPLVPRR